MLDYYSENPKPSVTEMVADARRALFHKVSVHEDVFDKIATDVCTKVPDFSFSGWYVFGRRDAHNKILAQCNNWKC